MKKQLTIIAFAAFALSAWAQEENQFTVDAQLRTRVEYNNGASTPRAEGESPATYINERARLSMGYLRNNFEMKASIQHTGLWGDEDVKTPNGKVALNEAWAKLKFGKGYFAQIGRQQLSYDDERILGTLEWHVAGNWHDALKLGYENGTNKLHLIMAWNQNANNVKDAYYTGPMDYRDMQTLWYHYQAPKTPLGVSFIFMNLGRKDDVNGNGKANYMQTLGTDLTFKPAEFDIHGALYYQMGKDATGIKHSAWMASAKVGYKLNPIWGVKAGYDYRSGNDGSDKIKAFDQLYGSHHLFNGAMDYFLQKVPLGLHDIQAGITGLQGQTGIAVLLGSIVRYTDVYRVSCNRGHAPVTITGSRKSVCGVHHYLTLGSFGEILQFIADEGEFLRFLIKGRLLLLAGNGHQHQRRCNQIYYFFHKRLL